MRLFLRELQESKNYQLLFLMFSLLIAMSIVLQAYSIVNIVDIVFIGELPFANTFPYLAILLFAIALRLFANYLLNRLAIRFATYVKNTVREKLLTKWQASSFETIEKTQAGHRISLFVDTVEQLDNYFREFIPLKIKSQVVPIILIICIIFANPESAIILVITAPFIPLSYIIIGHQTKQKSEKQLEAMNRFSGKFLDLLYGLQTLKLFSKTDQQRDVLQSYNTRFMNTTLSVLKIAFASTLFIELITTLGVGLVALEIGFEMIVFETILFASAFFVLTLAPEFYSSLKELGAAFHAQKGSLAAMELLNEEFNQTSQTVSWGGNPIGKAPALSLQQAVFQYENGKSIGPLNIAIPARKTVAIIGPTGHGKTTALYMLAGFIELYRGQLCIDKYNQHEVLEQNWYDEMSFISQSSFVFSGTVRDNLAMGKQFSDEEMVVSLVRAQLEQWLKDLPDGLDTKIGEGGIGLSGGEKQRIAIARAIVQKPSIVFFDEPTAGLDVFTEQMITKAIESLSHNATIVLVTHRYETLRYADFIYCMEGGVVRASGTHLELLEDPLYKAMKHGGAVHE